MNLLRLLPMVAAAAALAAGCTTKPVAPSPGAPSRLALFSDGKPGEPVPPVEQVDHVAAEGQQPVQLVQDGGRPCSRGVHGVGSGLLHDIDLDVRDAPILSWRWKVMDSRPPRRVPTTRRCGSWSTLTETTRRSVRRSSVLRRVPPLYRKSTALCRVMYIWAARRRRTGGAQQVHLAHQDDRGRKREGEARAVAHGVAQRRGGFPTSLRRRARQGRFGRIMTEPR